jgi:hypothetical protein
LVFGHVFALVVVGPAQLFGQQLDLLRESFIRFVQMRYSPLFGAANFLSLSFVDIQLINLLILLLKFEGEAGEVFLQV